MNAQPTKWDLRFLELAAFIGSWSKTDRRRPVVLLLAGFANPIHWLQRLRKGVDDDQAHRHERPTKYSADRHERNAIYNASRLGVSLVGTTCYVNWFPCVDCARAIIQVGARRLVGLEPDASDTKWGADFEFATAMFREVGLEVALFDIAHVRARR